MNKRQNPEKKRALQPPKLRDLLAKKNPKGGGTLILAPPHAPTGPISPLNGGGG